jgi:hypothetical protein
MEKEEKKNKRKIDDVMEEKEELEEITTNLHVRLQQKDDSYKELKVYSMIRETMLKKNITN